MNVPATIILNGSPYPVAAPLSVTLLLEGLGLAGKPVVIELDEQAIFSADYERTIVQDGARVEIVTLAAGG